MNVNNGNEEVMWVSFSLCLYTYFNYILFNLTLLSHLLQVSRFSGELCYQAPYVVFFVLALITLIFLLVPFLFFIFAISIKEFVVSYSVPLYLPLNDYVTEPDESVLPV